MKTTKDNLKEIREAAYKYRALGLVVLPLVGYSKIPALKSWLEFETRKPSDKEFESWFSRNDLTGLGILAGVLSGVLVVDQDYYNVGAVRINLPTPVRVLTPNGGEQDYFKYSSNVPKTIDNERHFEIRTGGDMFCVLPPSIVLKKDKTTLGEYKFANEPDFTKLTELDLGLISFLVEKKRINVAELTEPQQGSRHTSLLSLALSEFSRHRPEEWQAVEDFVRVQAEKATPPYTDYKDQKDVERIIGDAEKFILENPKDTKSEGQSIYKNDLATHQPLKLTSFAELRNARFPENKWVVDRLISENGINCLSGQPKVGKSITSLDLAICLALGKPFLGEFSVEKSNVLFVTKEDPPRLIQERLKNLTGEEELPIYFCTESQLFLDTDTYLSEIEAIIKEKDIKVIIIDSFRRIFKGEENSSQVISEVHNRFKKLLEFGITIIFIHHHGKEGFFKKQNVDKLRGSSDILAMLDSLLIIDRKDDSTLKVTQATLRADKPIAPFIIGFPTFSGGDNNFKFLGYVEEDKEKKELAEEEILNFLKSVGEANQKTIIDGLKQGGKYGATHIKDGVKSLVEKKKIQSRPEGREKIYFLPKESPKESGVAESEQAQLNLGQQEKKEVIIEEVPAKLPDLPNFSGLDENKLLGLQKNRSEWIDKCPSSYRTSDEFQRVMAQQREIIATLQNLVGKETDGT